MNQRRVSTNDLYQSISCLLSACGSCGIEKDVGQRDGSDLDFARVVLARLGDDVVGAAVDEDREHPALGARLTDSCRMPQRGRRSAVEDHHDAAVARLDVVERRLEDELPLLNDSDTIGNAIDLLETMG